LERDEVQGVWKQSFREVKRLKNAISDIHHHSPSIHAEGHEPEYLSKIHTICLDVIPKQEYMTIAFTLALKINVDWTRFD
jgi:hypothetical protein